MVCSSSTPPRVLSCNVCNRVNAAPIRRSNSILAATAFACRSSSSTGARAACKTCLSPRQRVLFVYPLSRRVLIRFLGVAESSSFHLDAPVAHACLVFDFGPDMLPFSITISPYEKSFGEFRLLLDILRNGQFVLHFPVRTAS